MEWLSIGNDCWIECGGGGLCPACMNYESSSTSGYCCSGINHQAGGGPMDNGDCPAEAIAAQLSNTHSCVVSIKSKFDFVFNRGSYIVQFCYWLINIRVQHLVSSSTTLECHIWSRVEAH